MRADDELVIQADRHPRGWIMLPLTLALPPRARLQIRFMLNTGRPRSALNPALGRTLMALDLIDRRSDGALVLRGAHAGDEPLPDLPRRLSVGPALLGLDGMLGLDFLDLFAGVRLDTRSLRLTLVR